MISDIHNPFNNNVEDAPNQPSQLSSNHTYNSEKNNSTPTARRSEGISRPDKPNGARDSANAAPLE